MYGFGYLNKAHKPIVVMNWVGVTSFNIDFGAKKVTIVGDVAPLQVLASVSKVKSAQFWTSHMSTTKIWCQDYQCWTRKSNGILVCTLNLALLPLFLLEVLIKLYFIFI